MHRMERRETISDEETYLQRFLRLLTAHVEIDG